MNQASQGVTLSGPTEVEYGQWAFLKANLKMERVGLKHSAAKGKALRPMYAKMLGLKARDDYQLYIDAVQAKMDALIELRKQEAGHEPAAS